MKSPLTFFKRKKYQSELNGTIIYQRLFNSWCLKVGSSFQSGSYIRKMWKKSLKKLPYNIYPKNALILGVAGGDFIPLLRKKFPKIKITGIEWDPTMIKINQEQNLYPIDQKINIINTDAKEYIAQTNQKYDLILVDLYKGCNANPALYSEQFINNICRIINNNGYVILNAYTEKNLLGRYLQKFTITKKWSYKINKLALLQPQLPADYIFHRQSKKYLQSETLGRKINIVGNPENYGNSWKVGPITFEAYYSDKEPKIKKENKLKIITWNRITSQSKPKGWLNGYTLNVLKKTGIVKLKSEYWTSWTKHAQRHRKNWLKQDQYKIIETDLTSFIQAFKQCKKLYTIREDFIKILVNKNKICRDKLHLYAVTEKNSNEILAGLAVLDIEDIKQGIHVIAFHKNKIRNTSINYGLIDHWFKTSLDNNTEYLNFGTFYEKGCPKSWQGFSYFKSQFGIRYIIYPMILIKIIN